LAQKWPEPVERRVTG